MAILVSVLGILLAYLMYAKQSISRDMIARPMPWLYQLSFRKYYVDEIYHAVFVLPLKWIGWVLDLFDRYVVDGLVQLVAFIANTIGAVHARIQNGQMQTYGFVVLAGLVLLVIGLTAFGGVPGVK